MAAVAVTDLQHKAELTPMQASRLYGECAARWAARMDAGEIRGRTTYRRDGKRRMRLIDHSSLREWRESQLTPKAPPSPSAARPEDGPVAPPLFDWATTRQRIYDEVAESMS